MRIRVLYTIYRQLTRPRANVMLYLRSSTTMHIILEAIASVPGRFFSKDTEGKNTACYLAHVLTYSPESGESPFSFFDHVSIYVKQLSSLLRWLRRLAH